MQTVDRIFCHWTGTPYNWNGLKPNNSPAYHSTFNEKGRKTQHMIYSMPLSGHTYRRNSNSIALSCCCMGGEIWEDYPPTHDQIDAMCKEAADVAIHRGWLPDLDFLEFKIMTHAEAAGLRDYPLHLVMKVGDDDELAGHLGLPHGNYGLSSWKGAPKMPFWPGGSVERWDWGCLHKEDMDKLGVGGYQLRKQIVLHMKALLGKEKK